MPADRFISEDELHAYVDGDMAPARRVDIALYLARHPEDAARLEVFRAQREAIHALFDDLLDQPVPMRLRTIVRRHGGRPTRRRRSAAVAVGVIFAALVLATGRTLVPDRVTERDGATAQHSPAVMDTPALPPFNAVRPRRENFDI